jgi:hypothetical protein
MSSEITIGSLRGSFSARIGQEKQNGSLKAAVSNMTADVGEITR